MAHMDVLLKEDVEHLGQRGQVVRVRAGYGRNYLLPQKLAIEASTGNRRMIEEQQRVLAKREHREHASAQTEANKLDGLEVRFARRVGEHGLLYGSVTALDVAEELKKLGYDIERRRILLRDHIKAVGDYEVKIKLHRDVTPIIKVRVRKEGDTEEPAAAMSAPEAASEPAAETAPEAPGLAFVIADEAESAQE